ncbi:MAG: zinc-dependent metalloprotease, partial [Burkholderiaceae bacterium]
PRSLPDPRSLFMTLAYSIGKLPEQPMQPRAADTRVGFFTTRAHDFGNDLARTPTVRHVNRWRLEKRDPAATLSEPVKPIVYWLDRTLPLEYREAITGGILEWNKAFERIGFKDAIQVKVQPDDAGFDTLDYGVTAVRWMTNSAPGFGAVGLSHVDPRSCEILGADIAIESLSSRAVRSLRAQVLLPDATDWRRLLQAPIDFSATGDAAAPGSSQAGFDPMRCDYAELEADQLAYGLDVLAARGSLDPGGPEAQRFVLAYLRDVAMHETGHTLGLRHNFRASRLYSDAQLSDPEFTRSHALTGSVMEYAPINLAAPGAPRVAPFQTTLGPYDYWAIEYAYKPMAPGHEKAGLAMIAARSSEPELAYGTDEDNALGIDPDSLKFDLGRDAAAFASKRIAIARELIQRQETRTLEPDQDYAVLRRALGHAVRDAATAAGTLVRQIGGVRTLRDFPGSGRDPMQPLDAAAQREALDVLARGWFGARSFAVSPALQRRLAPDFAERSDALAAGAGPVATEFSLARTVLAVQRALLDTLLSDAVATRILDSGVGRSREAFQLTELYARLDRDIWSELAGTSDIAAPRRELQRAHLDHLATLLLRPTAASRVDRRGLVRVQAQGLLARIHAALRKGSRSADARAHLQD